MKVKPDQHVFNQMLKLLNHKYFFGSSHCFSGFDEQLICGTYYSLEQPFTHIHQCYNWCVGKWDWLPSDSGDNNSQPKIIHYHGDQKPWFSSRNGQWHDTIPWWDNADEIIAKDDTTRKYFELNLKWFLFIFN